MKSNWKIIGCAGFAILVVAGYCGYRVGLGKPFTLNQLANRQTFLFLAANPEILTTVGIVDGTILDRHSGKLTRVGVEKRDHEYAMASKFVTQLKEFDRTKLDRQDQITYDILIDQWETLLSFKRFDWLSSEGANAVGPGLYPISPMAGTQTLLPLFLETQHVVRNAKTARNYVKRLEAAGDKLDAVTGEMVRQAKLGVVLPLSLLVNAEAGIDDTVRPNPPDNPLVTTFVVRMKSAKGLDSTERAELARQATDAVTNRIYPAYQRMTAALESERAIAANQAAGVGRLSDGAAFYAAALKQMTSTDYTPDRVHSLGLSEVARITAEMDALLRSQGLSIGSVGERVQALHKDPRFQLPNSEAGRQQLLDRYQQILDEVNARMAAYFRTVPTGRLIVSRVPLSAEKGYTFAQYQGGAMDGSRPGLFLVNLRDVSETATWAMKTLAYHEGIPWHHFQFSIALGLKNLPLVRQQVPYTAFAEGWALYAEQLAAEIGMYKDDPFGDLGRLEAEIFRAARLVVDTGIHAKGWTREQAIAYMVDTTGMNESRVTTEVERYMVLPGQACAYKVGQLKIVELRERAKVALGSKFDLKDFHAIVLENGGLPLTVLESLVDEWIATARN